MFVRRSRYEALRKDLHCANRENTKLSREKAEAESRLNELLADVRKAYNKALVVSESVLEDA